MTLADLFLASARAVTHRLDAAGLLYTMQESRPIVERDKEGPGSMRTAYRQESRNILAVNPTVLRQGPWLTEREIESARACASMLTLSAAQTLPFWAPLGSSGWELVETFDDHSSGSPSYADDPVEWVMRFIVLPALQGHLLSLSSVDRADESAALGFAEEALKVAHDDHLRYQVLVPLSGMNLAVFEGAVLTDGDMSIRQLSDDEQGQWFLEHNGPSGYSMMDSEPPEVLLQVRTSGPRNVQHRPAGGSTTQLVAALQLHGFSVAGRFAPEYSDPRWVQPFAPHVPVTLPGRRFDAAVSSTLTANDFHSVVVTARFLEEI